MTFNKILYIEKKGLAEVLIADGWAERNDCAICSSEGQATRAVKDLFDFLGDEADLLFFCVHDADAYGTTIYDALQNETSSRPGLTVEVRNLGLEPEEAQSMGLQVEKIQASPKKRPVGKYVQKRWATWLQTKRAELNAMDSDVFIGWMDAKMEQYGNGKLIPPMNAIEKEAKDKATEFYRQQILDQIAKDIDLDGLVKQLISDTDLDLSYLPLENVLELSPRLSWRAPVKEFAESIAIPHLEAIDWKVRI